MLLAALRRLTLLLLLSAGLTAAGALLLGALIGASLDRALAVGFYGVGSFLMLSGFFVGNRGPARVKSESPGPIMLPLPGFGPRQLRWATLNEQEETINHSALFVTLGFLLVVIGVLVDSRQSLV
jgi:hypothetical protein